VFANEPGADCDAIKLGLARERIRYRSSQAVNLNGRAVEHLAVATGKAQHEQMLVAVDDRETHDARATLFMQRSAGFEALVGDYSPC
jgi:hypothetical protein